MNEPSRNAPPQPEAPQRQPNPAGNRVKRMAVAVLVGLGLLVVAVVILGQTLGDRTVLFRGHNGYYWSGALRNTNGPVSRAEVLEVLGREILPQLTNTMFTDTHNSKLRVDLAERLNDLPGMNITIVESDIRRAAAVDLIGDFGPAAIAAVPALMTAFEGNDKAIKGHAAVALARLQFNPDQFVSRLISKLDDQELQEQVVRALGEYGSRATSAIPKIQPLARARDKDLRKAATDALRQIDPIAFPPPQPRRSSIPAGSKKSAETSEKGTTNGASTNPVSKDLNAR